MAYIFKIKSNNFSAQPGDLDSRDSGNLSIFSKNLSSQEIDQVIKRYDKGDITNWFEETNRDLFFLCLYDKNKKIFFIANNKIGSNDILYYQKEDELIVSDNAKTLFSVAPVKMEIDFDRVYECITFLTLIPPKTIYKNIFSVPIASFLKYSSGSMVIEEYWNVEKLFNKKENNYNNFVTESRKALISALKDQGAMEKTTGVSLSSGVDSGGLISLITKESGVSHPSVTIGPRGPKNKDLVFAKKIAEFNNSPNEAIYPAISDLIKLKDFMGDFNQPIDSALVFANSLIFEKAKELNMKSLVFGFGSEMFLGNLKMNRLAYVLGPIERFVPFFFLRPAYILFGKYKNFSNNQITFLTSKSWVDRFLRARGPLFSREKKIFKNKEFGFADHFKEKAEKVLKNRKIGLTDKIVIFYYYSWVNYMQWRDFMHISRKFGVGFSMPFNSTLVIESFAKAKDDFRKLSKWNKQPIRDIFRPYTNEEMYKSSVGSLIIPYNEWFKSCYRQFIPYLKSSYIISNTIDLEKYEKEYNTLPEPGLNLMRLLGIALWYDANWNTENLVNFEKIFPVEFAVVPISQLKPLEQVFPTHLENLAEMIENDGRLKLPIYVDIHSGTVLDGSHRYAYFYREGYEEVPVKWVDYNDENIRVGTHLTHRFEIVDDTHISKKEVVRRGLEGDLYTPRTTRHFFPFRKTPISIALDRLKKGNKRDISHILAKVTKDEEIEHNSAFIGEIEKEIEIIDTYLDEAKQTKEYLEKQVVEMKKKK